ncbi:protein FLUORESCENT IN BLUE LIGHT, chloroplastic-like isoform X2 [Chenopodium quinoa]|uniref:protein FLUORESCENT IN BLUE LIGHT, chloroplastic-like isoform X2 n=1 Tax=Chenopodium quinoa TaxID=63459 RepID=UPI000B788954|nr:protein FLUORESCENT IN BLUE LIGHT, chloroplastic-like isoform X2 [Chenopodium quinoa]
MAMIFHCSSLLTPVKQSGNSSWQQLFSRKFKFEAMLPYDSKKLILSSQVAASALSKIYGIYPGMSSMNWLQNKINIKSCFHASPSLSKDDYRSHFVNLEARIARFPTGAVLLTNAMFLAMPSEALAETSEAVNSFFNMPVLLFVALVGATVGGLLARQRKGELERLNEQLRQINAALRRQAKIESYAPSLSYAPVSNRVPESEVIVDPKKEELISRLKAGKNYLRNQEPDKAFTEFKVAQELAKNLNDPIEEKKAARGLGASLQRQGKYREAIRYHNMVLGISKRIGETSGNTEAYGAIADCYTELGDLEKAGKFYDKYIARLED